MSVSFFDMFAGTRQCRATFRARSLTTLKEGLDLSRGGVTCLDCLIHVELMISAFLRTRWVCERKGHYACRKSRSVDDRRKL